MMDFITQAHAIPNWLLFLMLWLSGTMSKIVSRWQSQKCLAEMIQ